MLIGVVFDVEDESLFLLFLEIVFEVVDVDDTSVTVLVLLA